MAYGESSSLLTHSFQDPLLSCGQRKAILWKLQSFRGIRISSCIKNCLTCRSKSPLNAC